MPDRIKSIDKLSLKYHNECHKEFTENTKTFFIEYGKTLKSSRCSKLQIRGKDAQSDLVELVVGLTFIGLNLIASKSEANEKLVKKLERAKKKCLKEIERMLPAEHSADAYTAGAIEINRSLKKSIEAYSKIFNNVYNTLYPENDESKSKEQRQLCKDNGGNYFTDEESESVIQLGITAQFLLELVDVTL
jgi:hypothetical protein